MNADDWNARHGIGTPVRYYPVLPGKDFVLTRTATHAWELSNGKALVSIKNHAGGVALSHLRVETPSSRKSRCPECKGTGKHMAPYIMGLKDGDLYSMSVCAACGGSGQKRNRKAARRCGRNTR